MNSRAFALNVVTSRQHERQLLQVARAKLRRLVRLNSRPRLQRSQHQPHSLQFDTGAVEHPDQNRITGHQSSSTHSAVLCSRTKLIGINREILSPEFSNRTAANQTAESLEMAAYAANANAEEPFGPRSARARRRLGTKTRADRANGCNLCALVQEPLRLRMSPAKSRPAGAVNTVDFCRHAACSRALQCSSDCRGHPRLREPTRGVITISDASREQATVAEPLLGDSHQARSMRLLLGTDGTRVGTSCGSDRASRQRRHATRSPFAAWKQNRSTTSQRARHLPSPPSAACRDWHARQSAR